MIADDKPLKNPYDLQPQAGPSYAGADVPPPSYTNAQVAGSFSASRSNLTKVAPSTQHPYPYAPSPDGTAGPALSGDNVKGFMGHVKNFAPGKSPTKLLDPPPECFARAPPPGPPYGPFPLLVLVGKGTTLDRGFPYAAPACPAPAGTPAPHPFVVHDVTEADWRRFLHDVRIAGSLSPMNKVVSGLAPLALGVGIIFGFFVVKGIDSIVRRRKKGPVSQLIDHWNHYFFHPRCIHIAICHGPPKDRNGKRDTSQGNDKNWRIIVTYRVYVAA